MQTQTEAFPLGNIVATPGALKLLDGASMLPYLARHMTGDFGDLDTEDRLANEEAIRVGARIISNYPVGDGRIWIITEADRSATTILLPEEY